MPNRNSSNSNICSITLNSVPSNKRVSIRNPNGSFRVYHADALLKWWTEEHAKGRKPYFPNTRQNAPLSVIEEAFYRGSNVSKRNFMFSHIRYINRP